MVRTEAWPEELLRSNLRQLQRSDIGPRALTTAILRSGSIQARRLLAYRAVRPPMSLEALAASAHDPDALRDRQIDPKWMSGLARVHLLGGPAGEDSLVGLRLYDRILERCSPRKIPKEDREAHLQAAAALEPPERVRELLRHYKDIDPAVPFGIETDLANPWSSGGDLPAWLASFNRLLPEPGIRIAPDDGRAPFDRVESDAGPGLAGSATIAVMVTCFRPDHTLKTSLRSILRQTWRDLEVLLVDDGSGAEFDELLEDAAAMDSRIRLIRSPRNQGTYLARNLALSLTEADFVTTHDSDDWMHPRRLELQVAPMLADRSVIGTGSNCVFASERLEITRIGRVYSSPCAAALMFRRRPVLSRLGFMDSVRKAADTEYSRRMRAVFGDDAFVHLPENLTLVRIRSGSLSSGDFRAGWIHPARAAYRSSHEEWHRAIREEGADPHLARGRRGPFHCPRRFRVEPSETRALELVFAADLTSNKVPRMTFLNDLRACVASGVRVGVMHLPTFRFPGRRRLALATPIQAMINAGAVDHVLPDEPVRIGVLAVRNPSALQYPPAAAPAPTVDRLVILADSGPQDPFGEFRYDPRICEREARRMFGVEPVWAWRNEFVLDALAAHGVEEGRLAPVALPELIGPDAALPARGGFRGGVPVLGRFDYPEGHCSWPRDVDALRSAYPVATDVDVRVMGSAAVPLERLGRTRLPPNWTRFDFDESYVRAFLYQLDFFVCFPREDVDQIPQAEVLEALAAGCVVLLPHRLERAFGDGPVYCEAGEVPEVVAEFRSDPGRFTEHSRKVQQAVLERHDAAALVERLLGRPIDPRPDPACPLGAR